MNLKSSFTILASAFLLAANVPQVLAENNNR